MASGSAALIGGVAAGSSGDTVGTAATRAITCGDAAKASGEDTELPPWTLPPVYSSGEVAVEKERRCSEDAASSSGAPPLWCCCCWRYWYGMNAGDETLRPRADALDGCAATALPASAAADFDAGVCVAAAVAAAVDFSAAGAGAGTAGAAAGVASLPCRRRVLGRASALAVLCDLECVDGFVDVAVAVVVAVAAAAAAAAVAVDAASVRGLA